MVVHLPVFNMVPHIWKILNNKYSMNSVLLKTLIPMYSYSYFSIAQETQQNP